MNRTPIAGSHRLGRERRERRDLPRPRRSTPGSAASRAGRGHRPSDPGARPTTPRALWSLTPTSPGRRIPRRPRGRVAEPGRTISRWTPARASSVRYALLTPVARPATEPDRSRIDHRPRILPQRSAKMQPDYRCVHAAPAARSLAMRRDGQLNLGDFPRTTGERPAVQEPLTPGSVLDICEREKPW